MKPQPNHPHLLISLFILSLTIVGCSNPEDPQKKLSAIQSDMEMLLTDKMLDVWYPLAIDTVDGGYLSTFDHLWNPVGPQAKFIVSQARHLWTLSVAAERFPEEELYLKGARHGFEFIRDKMWDHEYGGFYDLRTKSGRSNGADEPGDDKRAYGNSFGIYGLATYARIANDQEALELAKEGFRWMEAHSYDTVHGGYNQFLTREGVPYHLAKEKADLPYWQHFKDQNSSIHILEAYTALYHVWPNDTLRERLHGLFLLIRDVITNDDGYMTLFFYQDWQPVSFRDSAEIVYQYDHVSFGHDIETAFLLLEASEALGLDDPETMPKTKKMVDHSLKGMDEDKGGLFYKGYYFSDELTIVDSTKSWWPQAEGLNSLLLFSGLYPQEEQYLENFISLWEYTSTWLIDWEHGGWYTSGIDINPEMEMSNKGGLWKTPYHTTRSLMECIDMISENERPKNKKDDQ